MKFGARVFCLSLLVAAAYLLLWPTPVAPVAWTAMADAGFTGPFKVNTKLSRANTISLGEYSGPEDIVAVRDNEQTVLFASSTQGAILKIDPVTGEVDVFAQTGGHPLGMERQADGTLIVADAHLGLLAVSPDGEVTTLTNSYDDLPLLFTDDLDIASDGIIYFSDASARFGAEAYSSPLAASELDILEQSASGRVLAYDPAKNTTTVVASNLSFANGVALTADGQSLLVAETGRYRVHKIALTDQKNDAPVTIIDNLPGFPDNINRGPDLSDGTPTYLLGLAAPRVPVLDELAGRPFVRKVISRLPAALKPAPVHYSFVMQFTEDGRILQTWQDPDGHLITTTGGIAPGDGYLYISSVSDNKIGRVLHP
ncbi:MAG: SMP-30/gluconolactonase/LRE family protein [Pseudomonadota bacterium]